MSYRVSVAARVETKSAVLGDVSCVFDAGNVEPKSEQEELALEILVRQGHAERIESTAAEKPSRRKRES